MSTSQAILMLAGIAIITALLRFIPFWIFGGKDTPPSILYLGKVLPYAIMAMLVIYCLKNVSLIRVPHGIPELLAGGVTVLLHLWKRNSLLSIFVGTAIYMLLIQKVFC